MYRDLSQLPRNSSAPRRSDVALAAGVTNSHLTADRLYAAMGTGLYVAGHGWHDARMLRTFRGASRGLRCIRASAAGALFVAPEGINLPDEEKGLWRSSDGGTTWRRVISLAGSPNPVTFWAFAEDPGGRLFAGVYASRPAPVRPRFTAAATAAAVGSGCSTTRPPGTSMTSRSTPAPGSCTPRSGTTSGRGTQRASSGRARAADLGSRSSRACLRSSPSCPCSGDRLFASDTPGGARIFRTRDDNTFETVFWDADELYFFWMRRDPRTGWLLASAIRGGSPVAYGKVYRSTDDGDSWHVLRRFEAPARSDGSPHASNVLGSRLLVHCRRGGEPAGTWDVNVAATGRLWPATLAAARPPAERALACLLLAAAMPVILLAALLVKLTSPGPACSSSREPGDTAGRSECSSCGPCATWLLPRGGRAPSPR